ncbi:MAG: rRNA pseudouridine synthase [Lachnospiraceae bacterium]|nr:rRNA pseudouridine synthase [Lachnospiraceae bacterium]
MRLDKYLADAGMGTRTEVKKIISKGRVEVNGVKATDPGMKVENGVDSIKADEKELSLSVFEYYMLNKPKGIISASRKNSLKRGEKVPFGEEKYAVDLIRESVKTDLFPAGRLDKDTEGLLLITNDGQLSHRLLSPGKHVDKTYYTELSGCLSKADKQRLEEGTDIGDEKPTKPCTINILSDRSCLITLTEGRYHQIKRMFATCGLKVTYLKRITFGPLALDNSLEPGEYRPLNYEELAKLLSEYES